MARFPISIELVQQLVANQFPQWTQLPITPASPQGWDNQTFRLGDDLSVRLPSDIGYEPQINKETKWLPYLADWLPAKIPEQVALGRPGCGYPYNWSVRRWVPGRVLAGFEPGQCVGVAADLGRFLRRLREVPTAGAPVAGEKTAFRGCPFEVYADDAVAALAKLDLADQSHLSVIARAVQSEWAESPVWFHGDVAPNNILVSNAEHRAEAKADQPTLDDGEYHTTAARPANQPRLAAVLDFGCAGVGDPACDLVIAYTHFVGAERQAFADAMKLDADTWDRARGWALWKAAITLANSDGAATGVREAARTFAALAQPE